MRRWIVVCAALCLAAVVAFLLARSEIGGSVGLSRDPAAKDASAASEESPKAREGALEPEAPERREVETPAPEAAPAPGELVVSVRTESGAPVVDWEVQVEPESGVSVPSRVQRWRTDREGRAAREVSARDYSVRTLGHPTVRCSVAPGGSTKVDVVLRLDGEASGIVLDPTRQPVPFAQLLLRQPGAAPIDAGRADAAARFRVLFPRGMNCSLSAIAPGFRASAEHYVTTKRTDLELLLGAEPARLTIVVTRADRSPAADCWVRVVAGHKEFQLVGGSRAQECATREQLCDRDGRVRLVDLWPGPADLTIREPDHMVHHEAIELRSGAETVHVVSLQLGAAISGTIHDEAGEPIAGAIIGMRWLQSTRSASDGSYRLGGLDPATAEMHVHHRDFCRVRRALVLRAGETTEWSPVLQQRPILRGRLVDAADAPLAGYQVQLHDTSSAHYEVRASGTTASDGRFALKLEDAQPLTVEVRGPQQPFAVVPVGGEQVGPSPDEVLLRLGEDAASTAWVTGRVHAHTPEPGSRIYVQIHRIEPGRWGRSNGVEVDPTDPRFRFGPLPPASYRLTLSARAPDIAPHEVARFMLRPHERRELGEVALGKSGVLVVAAKLTGGSLVEAPYVQIDEAESDRTYHIARLDAQGGLELACAPGSYRVTIYGGPFVWQRRELEIHASRTTTWTATLEPAIRRKLFFTLPAGETSCRFEVLNPDAVVVFDTELHADSFDSREWQPFFGLGRHHVRATGGSGKLYSDSFVVTSLEPDPRGIRIAPK